MRKYLICMRETACGKCAGDCGRPIVNPLILRGRRAGNTHTYTTYRGRGLRGRRAPLKFWTREISLSGPACDTGARR